VYPQQYCTDEQVLVYVVCDYFGQVDGMVGGNRRCFSGRQVVKKGTAKGLDVEAKGQVQAV
jgi:hypothetical protein